MGKAFQECERKSVQLTSRRDVGPNNFEYHISINIYLQNENNDKEYFEEWIQNMC